MTKAADDNFEFQKIVVVLGFSLLAIKYLAYWLTGSVAILTDATESIVNVVAACVGIYALYLSAKPADRSHPFGHGKVEIISSAIEGCMIFAAGLIIVYEAAESLLHPDYAITSLDIGLVLVALAAAANYAVGRAAIRKGQKNRSSALIASGRHLCSDTYSSVGILMGLSVVYAAQYFGMDARWLDSGIACVFGIIILVTGVRVVKRSVDDTMDAADTGLLEQVTAIFNEYRHDDWIDIYNLRLVKYGPKVHVDMKIVYPRSMTLEQLAVENAEINEAMQEKFGDAFETSIVSIPCQPFHCRYCARNCFNRSCDTEAFVEWNPDVLCTTSTHSPVGYVTVEPNHYIGNDE